VGDEGICHRDCHRVPDCACSRLSVRDDAAGNGSERRMSRRHRPNSPPATLGFTLSPSLACVRSGCSFSGATLFLKRPSLPEKSIAVLPFENLSEDKTNTYFVDGMQDEAITRLAKISELRVISRTSTQRYRTRAANLAEIARAWCLALGGRHSAEDRGSGEDQCAAYSRG
jgi:hypothetical protein